jgi:7-keto-8-aminopelargonate synthetase-like enzyme
MFTIDEFPGREIIINGKLYLYFGGTSYLGLQTDPEFQSIFIANIKKYGTGYGASRQSNIRISAFEETEIYLANLAGSEACITLSSGYLAGQLVCDYFNTEEYQLYYAPDTHSALLRGKQKVYSDWENIENDISVNHQKKPVLLLDSIDFNGKNYPEFKALQNLPLEEIILVVDDSHGIGITGTEGGGSFSYLASLKPKELLVSCSLGKGFGIQAGAIFGTRTTIKKLKETHFFGGASPAMPASIATLKDAHHLYPHKRNLLKKNSKLFVSLLAGHWQFTFVKGHPSFSFQNEIMVTMLEEKGILVTNFRYPADDSELMSRIVISASHTKEDIIKLSSIIRDHI